MLGSWRSQTVGGPRAVEVAAPGHSGIDSAWPETTRAGESRRAERARLDALEADHPRLRRLHAERAHLPGRTDRPSEAAQACRRAITTTVNLAEQQHRRNQLRHLPVEDIPAATEGLTGCRQPAPSASSIQRGVATAVVSPPVARCPTSTNASGPGARPTRTGRYLRDSKEQAVGRADLSRQGGKNGSGNPCPPSVYGSHRTRRGGQGVADRMSPRIEHKQGGCVLLLLGVQLPLLTPNPICLRTAMAD
jgi:hypothetical protein